MSHHQSLSATHLFHQPGARPKRPSRTIVRAQASKHARGSGHDGGFIAQRWRWLVSYLKTRKRTAACILVVVGGLTWFAAPFPKEFTLTDLLREQGYWETVPPAEYYLPGTINTLEVGADGRIRLHPTCKIQPELLSKITVQSRTVDRRLEEKLNKKLVIMDKIKDFLPIEVTGAKDRSLALSLHNSSILEVSDEELMQIQKDIVKGSCEQAIEINVNNGGIVCQTRSALRGDLVYEIGVEKDVSAHVNQPEMNFQIEQRQGNKDQLVGRGLIYGVRFVPQGIVLNTPDAKSTDCRIVAKLKS